MCPGAADKAGKEGKEKRKEFFYLFSLSRFFFSRFFSWRQSSRAFPRVVILSFIVDGKVVTGMLQASLWV